MRISGANRQVNVSRGSVQYEKMAHLWRQIQTPYDQLANKAILAKHGITEANWDAVRKNIAPYEPKPGARFLRPLDILDIKHADKESLFIKFATMVDAESRYMVPAATLEAAATLRGTTRPDSLPGAIAYSFSMFKNYPVSIYNMYGRKMMAMPEARSRVGFLAALGIGMITSGAIAVQLREMTRGKEPIDMHDPKFWGKVVMTSGALSVWGDFIFGGNAQGKGFTETAAGPLAGLAGDVVDLTVGSAFGWIDAMDQDQPFGGKWASKITEFVKRYNPVASNWYLRLALEREIFDQMQRFIDPVGARKRERAVVNRQKQAYGNDYYVKPGEHLFR
jgi:hypothetical protein